MFNLIKRLLNTKIKFKLIFVFIAVIVPMFCSGIYLIISINNILQENAIKDAFNDVETLKTRLRDTLYTTSTTAEQIYYDEDIHSLINNNFTNGSEYMNFYNYSNPIPEYEKANSQIVDITFYITKPQFAYNADYCPVNEDIEKTYWFTDALTYTVPRWQVIQHPTDGNIYLSYVRQVLTDQNETAGVMVIYISPEWIEGLMKEQVFNVLFSVQNGMVFYSNMQEFTLGNAFLPPDFEFRIGSTDTKELTEDSLLTQKGYTVATYFDYENTGNVFQIYLVKPFSAVTGETKGFTTAYISFVAICILLSILITVIFSSSFTKRIQVLRDEMHKVATGDFNLNAEIKGDDEINQLYRDLQLMVESMQHLINEAYEAKIQSETFKLNQREAEFKTLASQINPHFLYNTLETIRMKAYCNQDKETATLVKKLGKFMRRCLEVKDSMVTLESELEFTKSYLELQAARFGDRVSYSIYCEVDVKYIVLPLIIQPIVENAFVHGIESSKSNGQIKIKIYYKENNVIIDVIDNGQGIAPDKMAELRWKLQANDTSSGKSIGLTNVNKRIKMYHGEEYGLSISSEQGKGTRMTLTLPRNVDDSDSIKKELIKRNVNL